MNPLKTEQNTEKKREGEGPSRVLVQVGHELESGMVRMLFTSNLSPSVRLNLPSGLCHANTPILALNNIPQNDQPLGQLFTLLPDSKDQGFATL